MKKLRILSIVLVGIISSFFFVNKVNAYFTETTPSLTNTFSIRNTTTYTVEHKKMNLDGVTYTTVISETYSAAIGEQVTPPVESYTGFISPTPQTVTLGFENVTITYLYDRETYTLTLENEEFINAFETPSGDYLYGTQIHLIADEYDDHGHPFVKWSDGHEQVEYIFTMTEDVTLTAIYGTPYTVTFNTNGGSPVPSSIEKMDGETLGTLPTVTYDDCQLSTGSYDDRNCTYAYEFKGWYTEPTFEHKVNENYVVHSDVNLYAKWNKIYFHNDQTTFDGTNMLDTEIALFSEENSDKDFIVRFTLDSMENNQVSRAALFANMDERAEPYPGSMFRRDKNKFELVANVSPGNGKKTKNINGYAVGDTFVLKRESGILYYSVDGGNTFTQYQDYTAFSRFFDFNATFGGEYDANGRPYRYFKGTMSDMTIELIDSKSYTISYNANGGTGTMEDQTVALHSSRALRANEFTKQGYLFSHWTTNADGTGTRYEDEEVVSGLAGENEVITLYAQWEEAPHYSVVFDANGGTGTMDNQEFVLGEGQKLNPSQYTKEGYIFDSWNTQPDGSGTRYEEGQFVTDLTNVDGGIVTLYAQYGKSEYHYTGEITFDGVDDYIDTEVNLYSAVNRNKDYDISFDVIYVDPSNPTEGNVQPTIFNGKDETQLNNNRAPGFAVRLNDTSSPVVVTSSWGTENHQYSVNSSNVPIHYEIKRRDGIVTLVYSYGTYTSNVLTMYNQNSWEINTVSPTTITLGATYINGVPDRFFKGTIANVDIQLYD